MQFVVHDLCIILGVDIVVFLPRLQFLHKCAGLVFSVDDGFLEGLDDGRDFMLLMGFLGEDDRIGDLQNTLLGGAVTDFLRLSGGRSGGDVLGKERTYYFRDIRSSPINGDFFVVVIIIDGATEIID